MDQRLSSFNEYLSSLYLPRDPDFNLPPLDFNQENKDYWKLLSKTIITPFAPKYKLFEFKKYLKEIEKPMISFKRKMQSPGSSNEELKSLENSLINIEQSPSKIKQNITLNSIKEPGFSKKICLKQYKEFKSLKKSHSFIEEHQDLLTILSSTPAKVLVEDINHKSLNNFPAFEKIKPRLRSFLFLSNVTNNSKSNARKKPIIFNKMILEIRRKSCECKKCGGLCEKLQKFSNFLTEKESSIVIDNHQKLTKGKIPLPNQLEISSSNKKKMNYLHDEHKRNSVDEKVIKSAQFKLKRFTATPLIRKMDSLPLEEPSNNHSYHTPKNYKFTPVRSQLNNILNPGYASNSHRSEVIESCLFTKSILKRVSECNETMPLLINKSSRSNTRLTSLIEDKIKNSGRTSHYDDFSFNNSTRKQLFKDDSLKNIEKSRNLSKRKETNPYNNKYFFGVAKKLNLIKISSNRSLLNCSKKKENGVSVSKLKNV